MRYREVCQGWNNHIKFLDLAKIMLRLCFGFCLMQQANAQVLPAVVPDTVSVGAARTDVYEPMLRGKNVAFVINHTSHIGDKHLVDSLFAMGIKVTRIFAPEHGFRGEAGAGEKVADGVDKRTGAPIISLYGSRKKPNRADLADIDVVVFDIQDVGARFYTYISTMFYVMEACAEQRKPVIVLDRPNPNGQLVDGPVLDTAFRSFVGIAAIPIAHGCTVGELAQLFKGEGWIAHAADLALTVVPCLHYSHDLLYELPVKPSPNLPSTRAVLLYPSLCLFEGTTCSVGRGTDWPFEVIGHPDFGNPAFSFVPRPNAGDKYPVHKGWVCKGLDFRSIPVDSLWSRQLNLKVLLDFYAAFPNKPVFFRENNFFDLLAGTDQLRQQILAGTPEAEIRASWEPGLGAYKAIRVKYLLYE